MSYVVDKDAYFRQIGYVPHSSGQMAFHASDARFKVACCGRRYGKSTMAARDLEPELFLPKKRFWIVGPTYDLGEKEFRVIWDDLIIGKRLGQDKRVRKAYNKKQGEMYIEFPWQTRLEVRSADHPENLVGEALDGAIMSESAKHKRETWQRFIRPSLADKRGWGTFPSTPEGYNYFHELWQLGKNPDIPEFASWRFPSWENTVVYPGGRSDPEVMLLERTTTYEWFLQEIGAEFGAFVGKVYPEWDEAIHVRKHEFRPDWPNYMAFDWGFTNPLAAVEFQVDPMDRVHVWREHYRSYTTLEEHVEILKGRDQPPGYHLDLAFGDAADPEAAMYISTHLVACIAEPEAKKNWRQGIDLVKVHLKTLPMGVADEYGTPTEEPRLFVDHSCTNMIREFNNYKGSNRGTKDQNAREIGQKIDDHTLDAIRYGMVHLFILGANYHLEQIEPRHVERFEGDIGTSGGGIFTMSGREW